MIFNLLFVKNLSFLFCILFVNITVKSNFYVFGRASIDIRSRAYCYLDSEFSFIHLHKQFQNNGEFRARVIVQETEQNQTIKEISK